MQTAAVATLISVCRKLVCSENWRVLLGASIRLGPHSAGRSSPSTSITEAREARRQIEEKFDRAVANSSGNRLRRSDQTALLQAAYLIIRKWRKEHQADRIEEVLRRMARGWIAANSSLELVLLRSALPSAGSEAGEQVGGGHRARRLTREFRKRGLPLFSKSAVGSKERPGRWRG